jgi:hypothetical protein
MILVLKEIPITNHEGYIQDGLIYSPVGLLLCIIMITTTTTTTTTSMTAIIMII